MDPKTLSQIEKELRHISELLSQAGVSAARLADLVLSAKAGASADGRPARGKGKNKKPTAAIEPERPAMPEIAWQWDAILEAAIHILEEKPDVIWKQSELCRAVRASGVPTPAPRGMHFALIARLKGRKAIELTEDGHVRAARKESAPPEAAVLPPLPPPRPLNDVETLAEEIDKSMPYLDGLTRRVRSAQVAIWAGRARILQERLAAAEDVSSKAQLRAIINVFGRLSGITKTLDCSWVDALSREWSTDWNAYWPLEGWKSLWHPRLFVFPQGCGGLDIAVKVQFQGDPLALGPGLFQDLPDRGASRAASGGFRPSSFPFLQGRRLSGISRSHGSRYTFRRRPGYRHGSIFPTGRRTPRSRTWRSRLPRSGSLSPSLELESLPDVGRDYRILVKPHLPGLHWRLTGPHPLRFAACIRSQGYSARTPRVRSSSGTVHFWSFHAAESMRSWRRNSSAARATRRARFVGFRSLVKSRVMRFFEKRPTRRFSSFVSTVFWSVAPATRVPPS